MSSTLDQELHVHRIHIRGSGPTCASSLGSWIYPFSVDIITSSVLVSPGHLAVSERNAKDHTCATTFTNAKTFNMKLTA